MHANLVSHVMHPFPFQQISKLGPRIKPRMVMAGLEGRAKPLQDNYMYNQANYNIAASWLAPKAETNSHHHSLHAIVMLAAF